MTTMSMNAGFRLNTNARWASVAPQVRTLDALEEAASTVLRQHVAWALGLGGRVVLALVPVSLLGWMFVAG